MTQHVTELLIPEVGLTEIENQPRVRDIDLGERLGFSRPRDVRPLIERNIGELENFGAVPRRANQISSGKGRVSVTEEIWLNEEQALLVSVLSNTPNAPAVRAMLIRTFVAWRRGHLLAAASTSTVTDLAAEVRSAIGGIVKGVIHKELAETLPAMVTARLAEQAFLLRRGKTAGQIWRENGFPRMKVTSWFSNRLVKMGCQIEGGGRGELGLGTAKLFDPDKAALWLQNGGRQLAENYVAGRRGQTNLFVIAGSA